MSKLDAALALAARGFKVFPIAAGAKAPPTIKDWPTHATDNLECARRWWGTNADLNIGIHCEGLLVIDVDVKKGGDESLAKLEMIDGLETDTLTTRTPTGGRHLFYRLGVGHSGVANGVDSLGPGLDVRSTRGYVVAPGSEVPAGRYRFEREAVVQPAPSWLIDKCGKLTEREQAPKANVPDAPYEAVIRAGEWLDAHPGAVEGEGGDAHTYATACRLRDFGVSPAQALDLLIDWNSTCSPPWTAEELEVKVGNAYRYAQEGDAGKLAVSADDFPPLETAPAPTAPKAPKAGPQRLLELASGGGERRPYLVKGMLNRASHAVLYGAPGEGKTFVALDLAYHVAAGREWMGHRVRQGAALYLAFEGVGGLRDRGAALVRHYGNADVPLYVHAADMNLRDKAGRQELGAIIATLPEKPALIVIDTLARALKGGDENSAQDMGAMNDAVGALIASTGACVLLIHHSGKNKANGARGSSALLGAIDTEIQVDARAITATKQRDVEMGDPIGFRLHSIMLGVDEDGDEVLSCVIMPAAAPVDSRAGKLRGTMRLAWEALVEATPGNAPIRPEDWQDVCDEFLPKSGKGRAMYQFRKRFEKAGLIVVNQDCTIQRKME
jgi:hypothetical protein